MNYKKTYVPHNGYTPLCTIGECSLKNLEFGIIELTNGQDLTFETGDREVAFVILGGKASFRANGKDFGTLGVRRNVFENPKAECFYAPRRSTVVPWRCNAWTQRYFFTMVLTRCPWIFRISLISSFSPSCLHRMQIFASHSRMHCCSLL